MRFGLAHRKLLFSGSQKPPVNFLARLLSAFLFCFGFTGSVPTGFSVPTTKA